MRIEEIDKNFSKRTVESGMVWLNAREKVFSLHGVFYDEQMGRYLRMPQEVADKANRGVADLNSHTSGGRLRFDTDSPVVAIRAKLNNVARFPHMPLTGSAGFTLYADYEDGRSVFAGNVAASAAEDRAEGSCKIPDFVAKRPGLLGYTLFFPLYSGVSELEIGLKEGSELTAGRPYSSRYVVFYGHSITQGGCASKSGCDFVSVLSRRLNFDYTNLGFSGSALGEQAVADYLATLSPSLFVLDYDYNAPTPEHLEKTHYPLYKTVRDARPDTPILLISNTHVDVPDYDVRYKIVESTYLRAVAAGDKHIRLVEGRRLLDGREYDDCTVDGGHPTDLGFRRMADHLEPIFESIFRN